MKNELIESIALDIAFYESSCDTDKANICLDSIKDRLEQLLSEPNGVIRNDRIVDKNIHPSTGRDKRACPCNYGDPCKPDCTCVNEFSSAGCECCCTYGSIEQREAKANHLKSQEKEWWLDMLYQVQFVDYEENQWTVPVKLTQERFDKIKDDHSVTAIKLLPNTVIKS